MSILAPADKELLINQGLLSPDSSNDTRKIHKRRLNRSSDEENSYLPLSPISVVSSASEREIFSTIPEDLVSLATIKYLGYDDESAAKIWNNWIASAPGYPVPEFDAVFDMPFIDPIIGYSYGRRSLDTNDDNDEQWYACMDSCGINQDTQAAIMDPVFKRIRLTQSCLFWIRDTIEMRYWALKETQAASLEREMEIKRAASRPGASGPRHHAEAPPSTHGTSSSSRTGQPSVSDTMRLAPGISRETAMSKTALLAAKNAPGSITLYKGLDLARLGQLFNGNGNSVDIDRIISAPPSDFFGRRQAYYFAANRDIAEYYASFAKRRSESGSAVIIQVTIENSAIKSLPDDQLQRTYWPSQEWKELVHYSRKGAKLPARLCKFMEPCLIIGTIAKKPNWVYNNINSADEITESHVLKTKEGRNAIQYVFSEGTGEEFLKEHAVRNIKVFPFTTGEYYSWYEEITEESGRSMGST